MNSRQLVMGIISTYPLFYIKPFFTSLRKSGYISDVIVFTNNITPETESFLKSALVETIPFSYTWPYLKDQAIASQMPKSSETLSPNSLRYLLYNALLKTRTEQYSTILISDIRDVYFQKNPFDFTYPTGLSLFMEDASMTIGLQENNRYWIEHGFGQNVLLELSNKRIFCSGVSVGDSDSMLDYLGKMIRHICTMPNIPGLDQGIHNYLIHTGKIANSRIYEDDEGPVSTISAFKPRGVIRIVNGTVREAQGQIINIVHQYDRCDTLLIRWNFRYYVRHKLNILKGRMYFLKLLVKRN